MKQHLFTLSLLMLSLVGCTHNNGDIGPYFGSWLIDRWYHANDESQQAHTEDIPTDFMQFQSRTVCIRHAEFADPHTAIAAYGNWQDSDGILTLHIDPEQIRQFDGMVNNSLPYADVYCTDGTTVTTWRVIIDGNRMKLMRTDGKWVLELKRQS